tara:strand:+ start:251 stop:502 length:252 start_codon:yes stop_codon:yes gene_type:complete
MANNKIKKEELNQLKEYNTEISKLSNNIGLLEYQKNVVVNELNKSYNNLDALKNKLREDYGDITIQMKDGSFKISEDKEQKKN